MMSIHHKVCTCHLFFSWYKFWGLNFCKFSLLFMLVCCYLLLLSVNKQSKYFFHHWHLLTLTCWSSVLARVGQSICRTDSQVDHWPQRCAPSFQSHCLCGCHSCSKKDDLVWKTNPTEVHRLVRAHTHTHTHKHAAQWGSACNTVCMRPYTWDQLSHRDANWAKVHRMEWHMSATERDIGRYETVSNFGKLPWEIKKIMK